MPEGLSTAIANGVYFRKVLNFYGRFKSFYRWECELFGKRSKDSFGREMGISGSFEVENTMIVLRGVTAKIY